MRTRTLRWAVGDATGAAAPVCSIQTNQSLIPRVGSNGDSAITQFQHDEVERSPMLRPNALLATHGR
jgi:hypothetical protein